MDRFHKRNTGVTLDCYVKSRFATPALCDAIANYNTQYPLEPTRLHTFERSHDRWLIIDDIVYHFGASLKDLGKRWFSVDIVTEHTADDFYFAPVKGRMLKNIPIRVATSAERYCGGEQKWWSQPVSRPPCTPNQQAIANYSKLYPGGPIPHNLARALMPRQPYSEVLSTGGRLHPRFLRKRGAWEKVELSLQERRRGRKKPLSTRKYGMICMQSHFDNHVM